MSLRASRLPPALIQRDTVSGSGESDPLVSEDVRKMKRAIRNNFRMATAAIILALLLVGGIIASSVVLSDRIASNSGAGDALSMRLMLVENELVDLVMNTTSSSPVYTTLLEGTFDWVINDGGPTTVAGSSYRLRNLQVGSLNFTILEVGGPSTPYVFNPAYVGTEYRVDLSNWNPALIPDPLWSDESIGYPLTQANIDRVSVTGGCYEADTCKLRGSSGDSGNQNTIVFRNPGITPATMTIRFYFGQKAVLSGETLSFSEPWMLMIPTL